jgi:hypothetical protein
MEKDFIWDSEKALANKRKHGVSFETATLVFADRDALVEFEDHYGEEDRWTTTGMVNGELLLLVVHTGWEEGDLEIVRLISARRATRKERKKYEENRRQIYN